MVNIKNCPSFSLTQCRIMHTKMYPQSPLGVNLSLGGHVSFKLNSKSLSFDLNASGRVPRNHALR